METRGCVLETSGEFKKCHAKRMPHFKWLLGKMTSSFLFTLRLLFLPVSKVTMKVLCLNLTI